jgi:SAM-dependent methyltransferase
MTTFEDHFSEQAREYAQYRPQYPHELFDYLASIVPGRQLTWDCGTGNGQAACELTRLFERVVATDASPEQIAQATPHERIEYRVARAEEVDLEAGSVDLVTVAMAVHWFDLEPFYQAVRRAAKPGGILAVWMYHLPVIAPEIDQILLHYYENVLAGYWPERFHYLDERYRSLPFPFEELKLPDFEIKVDWELDRLAGFLDSWSGTRRYKNERGQHPLNFIWQGLSEAWGKSGELRSVRWPLSLRVGRVK